MSARTYIMRKPLEIIPCLLSNLVTISYFMLIQLKALPVSPLSGSRTATRML
jgi:hypothetical protein